MGKVTIHMQLTCTVRPDPDTDCYVSHCPALNVYSAGNTELEALEAIRSALSMYAISLYKQNRLDEKLLTTGFFPAGEIHLPKASEFVEIQNVGYEKLQTVEVDVPLFLQRDGHPDECVSVG
jgi:predicted RNase H-like HicB family nuclease